MVAGSVGEYLLDRDLGQDGHCGARLHSWCQYSGGSDSLKELHSASPLLTIVLSRVDAPINHNVYRSRRDRSSRAPARPKLWHPAVWSSRRIIDRELGTANEVVSSRSERARVTSESAASTLSAIAFTAGLFAAVQ